MAVSGPIEVSDHDTVIENMIIVAEPTDETALYLKKKNNVTIRNVVIYHTTNARGIYA